MSAENAVVSPVAVVAPDAVKQKKPTLPGKYAKLFNFGYWFASMAETDEIKTQFHNVLCLFGTVEEQTELFERFLAEEKDTAKLIRKRIAEHNKPPKPVKEKKSAKATRKGKAVVHQDELISQLIADANAVVVVADPKAEKEAAKLAKEAEKEAAKLAKEAEKEAARLAKEAEKEAARLAKEAEKEAARLAKEAEKTSKPKQEKKAKVVKQPPAVVAPLDNADVDDMLGEVINTLATTHIETTAVAPSDELVAEVIEEPVAEVIEEPVAEVIEEPVAEVIEEPVAKPLVLPVEKPQPEPKSKKTATAKEPKVAKEPKAKEPKTKADKKTKKAPEPEPAISNPVEEEEEEIQTRIATIGDKDYLIDQDFNVYNLEEPHDHIGTYNQETGAIDAI
jgi:hypothetical protein